MRIAIAEDSIVYRAGLVRLAQVAGVDVTQEASSGAELLAMMSRGELPDVAVLDINMSGVRDEGLVAALTIVERYPGVGVLLLSASADAAYAERLFEGGSAGKGYLLKDSLSTVAELSVALERVSQGQTYSDPRVVDGLLARQRVGGVRERLTPREQLVLAQLASGASNAAIAHETGSSTGAIEAAVSSIYTKLGIPDQPSYNRRVLVVLQWLRSQAVS